MENDAPPAAMIPPAADGSAAPPELTPRQKQRLQNVPPEARKVIEARKFQTAPVATDKAAAKADDKSKADDKAKADALPDGVIDFSAEAKGDDKAKVELPDEDVVIDGLDAEAAKKLKELNHKQQTFRKRTQEAEKLAKEAADKLTAAEKRAQELETENATLKTAPGKRSNWYANITDEKQLSAIEQNVNAGLRKLQRAMLNPDEPRKHTFLDGTERELGADDLDMLTSALDHIEQQREGLGKAGKSQAAAQTLISKMSGVDGFEKHHKAALAADWEHDRPTLAAKLAVAELALSGDYVLVPRGTAKKTSEKAPAAKSAGTSPAEMAPPSASQPQKTPPAEIAGTMPSARRGGTDYDALLSAAKARAATGDKSAVLEMLRLKRERRTAERQAA